MKKYILLSIVLFGFVSCSKETLIISSATQAEQTLFLYMPWSTDLTTFFTQNIIDLETALNDNILQNNRVIVFFSSSATEASMFEIKYRKGEIIRTTLKEYTSPVLTTKSGIASILNDVISFAPANRYAMIISSHGNGWLPAPETKAQRVRVVDDNMYHWELEGAPVTRFFGGTTSDTQTNISTLAAAIAMKGIKMDYILFDDCYMSTVEVAYDLKDVTDYLIASPTEVMAYGFPYHKIGKHLFGDFNLQGIVDGFYEFYKVYPEYPHGTIGVTVCAELDNLAAIMKEINQRFSFNQALLGTLQRMDGYSPVIFFDFGDYVKNLCTDQTLLDRFEYQFERTTPTHLRLHTRKYYSRFRGPIEINTYSGITISDPSVHPSAAAKTETAWYKATH